MNRRNFLKLSLVIAEYMFFPGKLIDDICEYPQKNVYLTIDDGPKENLHSILRCLGENHKVTFFMIGRLLKTSEGFDLACKALELGHEIGNHSYTHPQFSKISINDAKEEIERTGEIIDKLYAKYNRKNHKLFRFPYGDSGYFIESDESVIGDKKKKKEIEEFLEKEGYTTYFWDRDSEDWKNYSKKDHREIDEIMKIVSKTKEEEVVLMHELPLTSKYIIPFYTSSQNYNLKTLVDRDKKEIEKDFYTIYTMCTHEREHKFWDKS